ncbi:MULTISPECIES: flagellar hook assembly protein FlgD [Xanthobacter]|uniref:flagellar hook assembly protein FlgD n=1 Tax=Xanthobacter TaxID=279 RepID=UPI001F21A972|nr:MULTISPECIES: flagellar hook assembly protein FlgD [unclassified Xanthobacter]
MTSVSSTTSAAAATSTKSTSSSAASATSIDYDTFLQLLVAQLQNQDPTNPMDSTAYLSQLASFSQVEQQITTNSKLDAMLTSSALQSAESAIGKTLTSADGSVSGTVASVQITSDGVVATLTSGKTVAIEDGVTLSGS